MVTIGTGVLLSLGSSKVVVVVAIVPLEVQWTVVVMVASVSLRFSSESKSNAGPTK